MMTNQAWQIPSPGKLVLNDLGPPPAPGPKEILVRIHAFALNYRDIGIAAGFYPFQVKDDVVPLSDGAGDIVAVGILDALLELIRHAVQQLALVVLLDAIVHHGLRIGGHLGDLGEVAGKLGSVDHARAALGRLDHLHVVDVDLMLAILEPLGGCTRARLRGYGE